MIQKASTWEWIENLLKVQVHNGYSLSSFFIIRTAFICQKSCNMAFQVSGSSTWGVEKDDISNSLSRPSCMKIPDPVFKRALNVLRT